MPRHAGSPPPTRERPRTTNTGPFSNRRRRTASAEDTARASVYARVHEAGTARRLPAPLLRSRSPWSSLLLAFQKTSSALPLALRPQNGLPICATGRFAERGAAGDAEERRAARADD